MTRWIIYIFIAYGLLNLYAYLFMDFYIFLPPKTHHQILDNVKLPLRKNLVVSAIYLPNKTAKYTVLINHGNAEDLGYMLPFLEAFRDQGFAVFAYDYPGYGKSSGRPTEKNAYLAANAAYNYLTKELHIPPKQLILYGRSLGAALAIDLAAQHVVAGLIIEAPFLTASRSLTQIPLLVFDKFDNLTKIKNVHSPVLIIHGNRDNIIPFWQGKKLYQTVKSKKYFFTVKDGSHNNLMLKAGNDYWQTIHVFSQQLAWD